MATKVKPSRLQVSGTPQVGQVPVYVNEDCFQWCNSGGCAQWGCITGTLCNQTDLQGVLDCKADCSAIPTDNCQLTNGCGYTTCTGTVVASDLTPYAKSCDLCTVATTGKYCDLTGRPTIPTDNCQLVNGCGYTTCTGTLVPGDLATYAKCCDIPTNNNQLTNGCGYTTCTGTVVASDLTPYAKTCDLPDFSCYQTKSCMVCNLTSPDDSHYPTSKAVSDALQCAGAGDMLKSVYDPNNCNADAFDYCNFSNTPTIPTDNCQLANGCGYTTCTGTVSTCTDVISALGYTPYSTGNPCNYINNFAGVISALGYTPYNTTNPCGYTTCTGTISTCAQIISALGYTPYNSTNPNGYTTCTGTLVASDLTPYVQECCVACINGCCLTQGGDICIQGGGGIQMCPTSPTCITYKWIGSEQEYCNLGTYCPGVEYNIY